MSGSWMFDTRKSGASEGWAATGLKHFQANPVNSLAREIIQNSMDAKDQDSGQVIVSFNLTKIDAEEFPGRDKIHEVVCEILDGSRKFIGEKDRPSILDAKNLLERDNIPLLQITEEGTIGMEGPCEAGFPFYKYIKASSQSGEEKTLGSHGQGKNAPLVNSTIRTIFASSKFQDRETLIMGRATLASHYDSQDETVTRDNVGFFGDEHFQPIEYDPSLPDWLKRETNGTNISIIGFNGKDGWDNILCAAVARTFFTAIHDGKLIVDVEKNGRSRSIDSDTLVDIFKGESIISAISSSGDLTREDFYTSLGLYEAYAQPDKIEDIELQHLGKIKVFMKKREDEERTIGLVRDDMFITTEWKNTGATKLTRLPRNLSGFDVLIIPQTKYGAEFIRSMEPPAHDKLEVHFSSSDEAEIKKAKSALKELGEEVRKLIDQEFGNTDAPSDDFIIADEWFSFESDKGKMSEDFDPTAGYTFQKKKVATKPVTSPSPNTETPYDIEIEAPGEPDPDADPIIGPGKYPDGKGKLIDPEPNPNPPPGSDLRPQQPTKETLDKMRQSPVKIENFRMVPLDHNSMRIFFTPQKGGQIRLLLAESGANSDKVMEVKASEGYAVDDDGSILVKVEKGKRASLDLVVKQRKFGAVSIKASASK